MWRSSRVGNRRIIMQSRGPRLRSISSVVSLNFDWAKPALGGRVAMAQATRTTSPFLGWIVLIMATAAVVLVLVVAFPSGTGETATWKTLPEPAPLPMADESGLAPVDDIQMWYARF